jgi:hypothetical protein
MVLLGGIGGGEFGSEIGEVGECELAGVGAVADTEKADIILNNIAVDGESETTLRNR